MNKDKQRLATMLEEKKISKEDHDMLQTALKRKSFFAKMQSSIWLNPFQKIAGFKALILGMLVLILTSYLGITAKLYFLGPLSMINALALAKQTISNEFLFLAYQNLVNWLVLSVLFIAATKLLQKQTIRVIDFLGTVALARFPVLLITIYTGLLRLYFPSILDIDMSHGFPIHFSWIQYLSTTPVLALGIWQIILTFYAFKESSGLRGKKIWWGFVIAIILGETIAQPLTTMFMN